MRSYEDAICWLLRHDEFDMIREFHREKVETPSDVEAVAYLYGKTNEEIRADLMAARENERHRPLADGTGITVAMATEDEIVAMADAVRKRFEVGKPQHVAIGTVGPHKSKHCKCIVLVVDRPQVIWWNTEFDRIFDVDEMNDMDEVVEQLGVPSRADHGRGFWVWEGDVCVIHGMDPSSVGFRRPTEEEWKQIETGDVTWDHLLSSPDVCEECGENHQPTEAIRARCVVVCDHGHASTVIWIDDALRKVDASYQELYDEGIEGQNAFEALGVVPPGVGIWMWEGVLRGHHEHGYYPQGVYRRLTPREMEGIKRNVGPDAGSTKMSN